MNNPVNELDQLLQAFYRAIRASEEASSKSLEMHNYRVRSVEHQNLQAAKINLGTFVVRHVDTIRKAFETEAGNR